MALAIVGPWLSPEFVAVKLSTDVLEAARQQAEADDRTLSAYLRRIIAAAVQRPRDETKNEPVPDLVTADRG
jgi:hypothetical protein